MKRFIYFISYIFINTTGSGGTGRCEAKRLKPISSIVDIAEIEQALKIHGSITVTNFILLRIEDDHGNVIS